MGGRVADPKDLHGFEVACPDISTRMKKNIDVGLCWQFSGVLDPFRLM